MKKKKLIISSKLQKICNDTIEKYNYSKYTHNIIQHKIKEWADSNDYICELEYEVLYRSEDSKRKGKIDIKLIINKKIYLIEIDSSRRKKSIFKLINNNADYKIWIVSNTEKINDFINQNKDILKDLIIIPIKEWR